MFNRRGDREALDPWEEAVRLTLEEENDAPRRRRAKLRSVAVAGAAFGLGAVAVTGFLALQEPDRASTPVVAAREVVSDDVRFAPSQRIEAISQAVRRAPVATTPGVEEGEPSAIAPRKVTVETLPADDALPRGPIRDVLKNPTVAVDAVPAVQPDGHRVAPAQSPGSDLAARDEVVEAGPGHIAVAQETVPGPRPYTRPQAPREVEATEALSADAEDQVAPEPQAEGTDARVKSAVNMRSGPDKGTQVIGVLPAGGAVQVVTCDGWCEVVHDGRRGFVYESFLDRAS